MVIQYLQSLGDNSKIGIKGAWSETSLVDGTHGGQCWSSELHALDRYRGFKPEGMLFSLPTFTKKKACGAPHRQLFFSCFSPGTEYFESWRFKLPGSVLSSPGNSWKYIKPLCGPASERV